MLRNIETHFSQVPNIDTPRSIFDLSHEHKTAFNLGECIPTVCLEVLPGDTFSLTTSVVARLQTLLTPIMDDIVLDTMYFFVPARLVWNHLKEFFGENTASPWAQQTTYTIPQIESPTGGWSVGSIADYLGVPPGVEFKASNGLTVNALPFRCYALIMQEWMRDQNLTDPLNIPLGDSTQTGSNGTNYINDVANGGMPFKAAKIHDIFTSCLPDPQKSTTPVTFPLISGNQAPVVAGAEHSITSGVSMKMTPLAGSFNNNTSHQMYDYVTSAGKHELATTESTASAGTLRSVVPNNLYADLTSSVGSVTVNQLRLSFQMQKYYEQLARGGSRYREIVRSMFSTTIPDARVQIPEYLGGNRFPLAIHQIANTTESSGSNLGDLGAMSNTADIHDDFIKSFSEHGYVIGISVARIAKHNYPQGLDRMFTRKDYFDFMFPVFSCIGEQPIYKYEIDATVRSGENRLAVFGYNEAWIHYRALKNRCSGEMRPGVANSLASWHLADYYTAMPSLSDGWIREDLSPLDRCLAVTSSTACQIFADFYFDISATRCMPMYSVPGLIDHF